MSDPVFGLSAADVAFLKELKREHEGRITPVYRTEDVDLGNAAPEVYLALTPSEGIAPLAHNGATNPNSVGDIPGISACQICRILNGEITYCGFKKDVYNLTALTIAGNSWVVAVRDKWGTFIAQPTATGGFKATNGAHIPSGGQGTATDPNGNVYSPIHAVFGAVNTGVDVWIEWDSIGGYYTAVQVACPSGSA